MSYLPSLLHSYTADPISLCSRLQQYRVWLDLKEHSIAHLYHQEAGSRIQQITLFFYSSAKIQVQTQILKCCKTEGKS